MIVGGSVSVIESCAFQDCPALTSVTLSDSVTTIGDYAFRECRNLESITIPEHVTYIGAGAFTYCDKLTSITFSNPNGWRYSGNGSIPNGIELSASDLSDPEIAARYLTLESGYINYYWYRKE